MSVDEEGRLRPMVMIKHGFISPASRPMPSLCSVFADSRPWEEEALPSNPPMLTIPKSAFTRAGSLQSSRRDIQIEDINWFIATTGLFLICVILLSLVLVMNSRVAQISRKTDEQRDVMRLQILILTELLKQLQKGKSHICGVCKPQWIQHAGQCYLFKGRNMGWNFGMGFCSDEFSTLAVTTDTEQMDFLRHESKKYFKKFMGKKQYRKFWIGLKYHRGSKQWLWSDGTPYTPSLPAELAPKDCAYLQQGNLRSQPCNQSAFIICQAEVQFGWP